MQLRSAWSARRFHRAVAVAMLALLGLAGLPGPSPVRAQIDGDTFADPDYGYTLTWDGDVWSPSDDQSGDLVLESDLVQIFFQSGQFYDGDAVACRDDLVDRLPDDPTVESVEAADDLADAVAEDDGRAYATLRVEITPDGTDEPRTFAERIECRTVVAGEAVLAITWLAPIDDYDDAATQVADLLAALDVPTFQAPGDEIAGVDGDSYLDPAYGFGLRWDRDDWAPFDPVDATFGLSNAVSIISFDVLTDYGDDGAACVEGSLDALEESPALAEATTLGRDGDDVAGLDDQGWSYLAVDADFGGTAQFVAFRCIGLPGTDLTLRAVHSGPIDGYEEQADLAAPVFESLTLPGGTDEPAEAATPEAPESASPSSDGTPQPEEPAPGPDEDASPTPEAAATPSAEPEPSAPDVDLDTFDQPDGAWSLSYDPETWTTLDRALYATVDLALRDADGALTVTVDTLDSNGAAPADVLDGLVAVEIDGLAGDDTEIDEVGETEGTPEGGVSARYEIAGGDQGVRVIGLIVVPAGDDTMAVVRVFATAEEFTGAGGDLAGLLAGYDVGT